MKKPSFDSFKAITRCKVEDLEDDYGNKGVLLTVETGPDEESMKRVDVIIPPDKAVELGNALRQAGTETGGTRH